MLQIHPNARTTPAVRVEIAPSAEPSGVLARRYGVSAETVRKWRQRGASDCLDRSARPHRLPWQASEEERAGGCALRRDAPCGGRPTSRLTTSPASFAPSCRSSVATTSGAFARPRASVAGPSLLPNAPPRARAWSATMTSMTSASSPSTASTGPSRRPATASGASVLSTSPSTGARAPSTSRSRTTRPRRAPSPSRARPRLPASVSRPC